MISEVVLSEDANTLLCAHLLQHYHDNHAQEDLCFALWQPSTGGIRRTALIDKVLLPNEEDRALHGNVSFSPSFLGRAATAACNHGMGLAFLHSHPTPGWQGMSPTDVLAERDVIAYPAMATKLPLVGLTLGKDGYWSARFWEHKDGEMVRQWCPKVRVVGPNAYKLYYNDKMLPPPSPSQLLRRTFNTWGAKVQNDIARMNVGIVGLGSVGSLVSEAMARIGITRLTLIDPDRVEPHNLDRLLHGTITDVGRFKVEVAETAAKRSATAENMSIRTISSSIQHDVAFRAALDCDIIFSCVDRPLARDVLNFIANAHLIPVIDGGIAIESSSRNGSLLSAHWRAHIVTPYHCCLRCNNQYNTSMVVMELDGSLENPSYVQNLPKRDQNSNQNVFPFSMSAAAMEVNLMLRYIIAEDWWPIVKQQDYQFLTAESRTINEACRTGCVFRVRRARGDKETPHYITPAPENRGNVERNHLRQLRNWIKALGRKFRTT